MIKNTFDILVSADRNETLKAIVDGLKKLDPALVQEIPPMQVVGKRVLSNGEIVPAFAIEFKKPENAEIITVWEEGKPKYYQIPKEYYDNYFVLQQEVGKFVKIMNVPTRILQGGAVVYDPSFTASNIFRDQSSGYFYSKYGYIPYLDWFKGMMSTIKKDDIYKKFLSSGADMSFLTAMDKMMTKGYIERKAGKNVESWLNIAKRYKNPLELFRDMNRLSELGSRVGAFKRALQKTGDPLKAMVEARQISGDYGVKGRGMRNASLMYAFLNPRLQHLKLTAETLTGKRGSRYSKVMKGLLGVTLPSVLLWYANNRDDESRKRYAELPEWRKYSMFNVPIPFTDSYLPVPKGFWGTLFGTSAEKLLDYAAGEDENFIADLGKYLSQEVSPISGWQDLSPTATRPLVEQMTNKNFRGLPVVPMRLEGVEAGEQYTDFTPEIYKLLGDAVGISPLRTEALINGYTAGTGRNIANIGDELLETVGLFKDDDFTKFRALGIDLTRMPVTKRFLAEDYTGLRGDAVRKFYDRLDGLEKMNKTVNKYFDEGKEERAVEYIKENPEYKYYYENMTNINKFKKFLTVARDIALTEKDKAGEINKLVTETALKFEKNMESKDKFDIDKIMTEILKESNKDNKTTDETKKRVLQQQGIEKPKKTKQSNKEKTSSGYL